MDETLFVTVIIITLFYHIDIFFTAYLYLYLYLYLLFFKYLSITSTMHLVNINDIYTLPITLFLYDNILFLLIETTYRYIIKFINNEIKIL